jgi:hypothetical protein
MFIIDSIDEIQELLSDDLSHVIKIGLTGLPSKDRYPNAYIVINNTTVWSGSVSDTELLFETTTCNDYLNIKLIYHSKTDNDTHVENNKIVENQLIRIDYIEIDALRFTGHQIHDIGLTTYELTDSQKKAYTLNNFAWQNVKTDTLYNNGVWEVNLKKPILITLMKQKQITQHVFEKSHHETLGELQTYFRNNYVVQ